MPIHQPRLLIVVLTIAFILTGLSACQSGANWRDPAGSWETVATEGVPVARHEAALVAYKGKLYLLGGRRINPVNVYDPATNVWETKSETPIELHHFQAVVIGDAVYIVGAMTGPWPNETPVDRVIAYYPERDEFEYLHEIPEGRRRGGAGVTVVEGKIYIAGGITNGHLDGTQAWLDAYDPRTGAWEVLPDAPHPRDHFQLAETGNKLYAFAGRRTHYRTEQSFELTTEVGDVFDLASKTWAPVTQNTALPTQRAGNMALAWGDKIIIGGGESGSQIVAHEEVEVYDTQAQTWHSWPALARGRHGSGFAVIDGYLYTASGCGNRGGEPELTSLERLKLPG